jgi:hypothetical protein
MLVTRLKQLHLGAQLFDFTFRLSIASPSLFSRSPRRSIHDVRT